MRNQLQARPGMGAAWAIGTVLAVAGVLCAPAFLTATAGRAQAQGGVGAGVGTAAATVTVGDASALPGENADVTVSFTSTEPAAAVQIDVLYNEDEALIDDPGTACALDSRLSQQSLSATFPVDQPAAPMRRLRLGVFPPLVNPNPTFESGALVTCSFAVGAEVALGTTIPLEADRTQVARDNVVICGQGGDFPCAEVDGVIRVGAEATDTPAPTETPTPTTEATVEPTTVPCTDDADCPDGQKCEIVDDSGTCVPDDCSDDTDCDLNEECVDGICMDLPCSGQDDCPLGTICDEETDTCQQIPCESSEMCPAGTECEDGFCTPECRVDGDCTDGFCVDNTCVECRDNGDCDSNETCQDGTCVSGGDALTVAGGTGMPGGTATLMVTLQGDGASEVNNTLSIADGDLAIAACTAAGEIPASFTISGDDGSSVDAMLGGEGSTIAAGSLYACDVSIAANAMTGSRSVTCSGAMADGVPIDCNDTEIMVVSEETPTPTFTPTSTSTPTRTFTPTEEPTNTPRPIGSEEDDGCAVVAPAQGGSGMALLLLLAPAFLLWGRRREG